MTNSMMNPKDYNKAHSRLNMGRAEEYLFMGDSRNRMEGICNATENSNTSDSSADFYKNSLSELNLFDDLTENTIARLFEYRGVKIAGFQMKDQQMLCLPQIYEIFLKSRLGGLHTVYMRLKRLNVIPTVCNVEQVRALRNLGAVQIGVNRCKLISRGDLDRLYEDCYTNSSRPGRPSKRCFKEVNWSEASKKMKMSNTQYKSNEMDGKPFNIENQQQNNNLMETFNNIARFATQQFFMQQMLASVATQATQQQIHQDNNQIEQEVGQEISYNDQTNKQTTLMCDLKDKSLSNDPLNLTMTSSPSENDSGFSCRNSSNISMNVSYGDSNSSNSCQNTPSAGDQALQYALSKLTDLIELATANLKAQRETILNEKCKELEQLRNEHQEMKKELQNEQKRARIYFRRYCSAKRETSQLREKITKLDNKTVESAENDDRNPSTAAAKPIFENYRLDICCDD